MNTNLKNQQRNATGSASKQPNSPDTGEISLPERNDLPSRFTDIPRAAWAKMAADMAQPLAEHELARLQGFGVKLDLQEIADVYLPLSRLLHQHAIVARELQTRTHDFLQQPADTKIPFIIGIAGSVAVGKSTVARVLRELLTRWDHTPNVALITTDGFLYSNAELEKRGLLARKGFPESYNRRALLRFVAQLKSGVQTVKAPVYSHMIYDVLPDEFIEVVSPDIVIIEGINVLQPSTMRHPLAVSDLFDISIYVDARTADIKNWFLQRFLQLRESAFQDPQSYFREFAQMDDEAAIATALTFWNKINQVNLDENIKPTRARANLILRKGSDHRVQKVLLRKL